MSECIDNIGEIVLQNHECFWIFPDFYMNNKKYIICSPWFSCMGGKWRLMKEPYSEVTVNKDTIYSGEYYNLTFRLWRKIRSSELRHNYTIKLGLITVENELIECVGNIDSDYGCELRFPDSKNNFFSENGLVKLFFNIQREENIACQKGNENSDADYENNKQDDESSEDEERSENEMKTEDEGSNQNKTALSDDKDVQNLTQDLKRILIEGQGSDSVVMVENHKFDVHKVMLVARSPVFAKMFQNDMAEKNTNIIDLPDCTAESFKVFLHYLYTGSADTILPNNVCNIYYAADKYQIDDLKEKCVKFMKNNLSIETFCDIIALSLCHGEAKLLKRAIKFFRENIKEILKTVEWQKYMAENPTQANELLIKAHNA